ncbi:MAG: hypothetical protein K9L66_05760, partial [Spirochaetaceae bacterium]|nr:hypothetical protein [Spirochaetaceae bacterium]MCF7938751.1 hypothetical protein [Spirochaetales bacterium]
MILLYDLIAAQPEGSSPVSGGGEYAVRIFYALLEQLSSNTEKNKTALHAVYDRDKPIDKAMLERAKEQSMVLHPVQNTKDVPGIIEKIGADKFFSALPMRFRNLHLPDHCEFIYTIHGLRPLELPWDKMEWHYFYSIKSVVRHCVSRLLGKYYIRARKRDFELLFSVANKQQIITVSKHSRYSLLSMFPKAQDIPIHTFFSPPLERNYSDETGASIIERLNLEPRSYYLVISANRWGKNSYRLIQVFKQLIKRGLLKRKI